MFFKKDWKFMVGMLIYTFISVYYILALFKMSVDEKLHIACLLTMVPIIFYYIYFQKIAHRNLFAFYVILGTFHFSLFAFTAQLYQTEILFQVVLSLNLIATIAAYAFVYFTICISNEIKPLYQIYKIEDVSKDTLEKVAHYIDINEPRFFILFVIMIIVSILANMIHTIGSPILRTVLLSILILTAASYNSYLVYKTTRQLPIRLSLKVRQMSLIFLAVISFSMRFLVVDSQGVFLYLSFILMAIYSMMIEHLKKITAEFNDLLLEDASKIS